MGVEERRGREQEERREEKLQSWYKIKKKIFT